MVAGGSGEVVAIARAAVTGKMKVPVRVASARSSTVTLMLKVPALCGVPDRSPVPLMITPTGKPVADQEIPPLPPVAANCFEYAAPAVAVGSGEVVVIRSGGGGGGGGPPLMGSLGNVGTPTGLKCGRCTTAACSTADAGSAGAAGIVGPAARVTAAVEPCTCAAT